ncbi:hypothetical protein GCM10023317_28280 [Actinopolymorpha pittospori]|uniref:Uncharacterized protein n=1 Tax=Actinopolymorpha pittospori TaxID=648752 RepID=A0A927N7M8_9ACTN|nr:hypothetical protein [Actinopolymorpha pittospori]
MKFRRVLTPILGALAICALLAGPAAADEPGWQSLGNSYFYLDADGSGCHTKPQSVDRVSGPSAR